MSDAHASEPDGAVDVRNGPPVLFLLTAALCVVAGAALAPLDDFGAHVLGYVAASVLAIVLVGLFRRVDLTRRLAPGYHARAGVGRIVTVLLLAAFAVAAVHVWAIATELAS